MAGVQIGNAFISMGYQQGRSPDNRARYSVWLDLPDGTEHEVTNLASGCGGGGIQPGMGSLLSFLGAAAESYSYRMRTQKEKPEEDSNENLFSPAVVEWAYQNSDEIDMLGYEMENPPEGEDEIPVLIEE